MNTNLLLLQTYLIPAIVILLVILSEIVKLVRWYIKHQAENVANGPDNIHCEQDDPS